MLKENNTRKGFFEYVDFLAFRKVLPEYLKGFVTFGYKTGWRYSEIANLTWPQIDLEKGIARLESGETKNDKGRMVTLMRNCNRFVSNFGKHEKQTRRFYHGYLQIASGMTEWETSGKPGIKHVKLQRSAKCCFMI